MTRPLSILRIADIADNRTGGMSRYNHFVSDELRARNTGAVFGYRDPGQAAEGVGTSFRIRDRMPKTITLCSFPCAS